ncbi:MAG TPA: shikimate dehydrogenase [Actinomycetota bacterium]|nr:shikimate dehydrogenase [Actinomycetota bacterium]
MAAVVGGPLQVGISVSPAMHNAAFQALELDWLYVAIGVEPEEGPRAVRTLAETGFVGMNVTMPHKVSVVAALDRLEGEALTVGAVNTIKVIDRELIGFNTDGPGLVRFLKEDVGATIVGANVLLIGAGGSARAIVASLSGAGATSITSVVRNLSSGQALAPFAGSATFEVAALPASAPNVEKADLIINATPLGQRGEIVPISYDSMRPEALVVDLVYRPAITPMVQAARDRGAIAHSGLGMLVRQAALSFEIWTGRVAPLDVMSAAAVAALKRG